MKTQVTHLTLDEARRRLLAMRAGQLGLSLTEYVGSLIQRDAEEAGLLELLGRGKEARRGSK